MQEFVICAGRTLRKNKNSTTKKPLRVAFLLASIVGLAVAVRLAQSAQLQIVNMPVFGAKRQRKPKKHHPIGWCSFWLPLLDLNQRPAD